MLALGSTPTTHIGGMEDGHVAQRLSVKPSLSATRPKTDGLKTRPPPVLRAHCTTCHPLQENFHSMEPDFHTMEENFHGIG